MSKIQRHALDKFFTKIASRKLIAWIVATILLLVGAILSSEWITLTIIYISVQGVKDISDTWTERGKRVNEIVDGLYERGDSE
jgi:hypothetical protein